MSSSRPQQSQEFEAQISSLMEEMNRQVQRAAGSLDSRERDVASELAERTRELMRSAESMEERARQAEARAAQQGQAGQQGDQQGQDGQQGDQQGQGGQQAGQPGQGGGAGDVARQLQREAAERRQQAEALRDQIGAIGGGDFDWAGGLDNVIDRFRDLQSPRPYADPTELADIQRELVEALRELDFSLRRHFAAAEREAPVVTGSGDVPEEYRRMVEEYYRSLAGGSP